MEKDDKESTMIRMGVSGWMFLLVPAYPGCPGSKAVKRSLLYLTLVLLQLSTTPERCYHTTLWNAEFFHLPEVISCPVNVRQFWQNMWLLSMSILCGKVCGVSSCHQYRFMKMIVLSTKDEGLMLQQHNRVQQTCLVILLMLIHACSIRSGQMHEI